MKEVSILTHPPIKSLDYIVRLLAYGYNEDPISGVDRPFLVVEYSEYGSLRTYLHRYYEARMHQYRPSYLQLHEFSLNVASGLEMLHRSKIVHGDVKLENVLVYDSDGIQNIAKLTDFGAALFEQDSAYVDTYEYHGTAKYNAPEIEGRVGEQIQRKTDGKLPIALCYKADVYSFGLLLWEIWKEGRDFLESDWIAPDANGIKDPLRFLDEVCGREIDGMLTRALSYCSENLSILRNEDQKMLAAFRESVQLSLRDDPGLRSNTSGIVKALAGGSK